MKYYNYSVKTLLEEHFGSDTIFQMRKPHKSSFETKEDECNLQPLKWQYADEQALGWFVHSNYLLDTIPEDDYIAYTFLFGSKKMAYLMFMVTEDDPAFSIDVSYAKAIIEEWKKKGYEAKILLVCIDVIYHESDKSNTFYFGTHIGLDNGAGFYEVRTVNGKDILVFSEHSSWMHNYKKIITFSEHLTVGEYNCIFDKNAEITISDKQNKSTIGKGYTDIYDLFAHNTPAKIVYQEFKSTGSYFCNISAGSKLLNLHINRGNLICGLDISDMNSPDEIIFDNDDNSYGSLVENVPPIISVRSLNPVQMYAYAIQVSFADGSIRNYYLKCFDSLTIPDECEIDDYTFSEDILQSVKIYNGNAVFSNGYSISKHILYYHGYRQSTIEQTNRVICDMPGVKIISKYKLPLKEFKDHLSIRQYWGTPDEFFGPNMAWIDSEGIRISDIALFYIRKTSSRSKIDAAIVSVEPHGKLGVLHPDASWLFPPIYETIDGFVEGCAKASRLVDGKEETFLLTLEGKEIPFNFQFNVDSFTNDRCPFCIEEWQGKWPSAGFYSEFSYVHPGKWGFIDSKGNIVVDPKYVFAIGYNNGGKEHSVVARYVNNELLWGVIDLNGKEVIPCKYPGIYCNYGWYDYNHSKVVAFQQVKDGPYGLMDFKGNVLLKPMFDFIDEYNPQHRLVTAGENEDSLGVYSLDSGKMIIPPEYEYVCYDDHMITCEHTYLCRSHYFDYNGKELLFPDYNEVYESDGFLKVRKDGKYGVIDWNGNIIVPLSGQDLQPQHYKKGVIITESQGLYGLSKENGTAILPAKYSDITLCENLVIASERTDNNWCICDSLFTLDGSAILSGPYRNISIDAKAEILTFETPTGKEFCKISFE